MPFSCSVVLQDIDINCGKTKGGLSQVLVARQQDVTVLRDPITDEVTSVEVVEPIRIEFNNRDGQTSFTESKTESNGLPVVSTTITVQVPGLDENLNAIYDLGRRSDLVAICFHNNDTITVSGYYDGLYITYEADSGTSISEKSYINVVLNGETYRNSIALDDNSNVSIYVAWNNQTQIWNNITNSWNNL
jgi:hypothetical protein